MKDLEVIDNVIRLAGKKKASTKLREVADGTSVYGLDVFDVNVGEAVLQRLSRDDDLDVYLQSLDLQTLGCLVGLAYAGREQSIDEFFVHANRCAGADPDPDEFRRILVEKHEDIAQYFNDGLELFSGRGMDVESVFDSFRRND